MKLAIIYTTTPSKIQAQKIAKILFKKNLVACIQFYKIKSMYIWDGTIQNDKEIAIVIKTHAKYYKKIKKCILKNHSYDVPQIYMQKIKKIEKNYKNWLFDSINLK